MGSLNASAAGESFRGWVSLRAALDYNLNSNHFPPLPEYVDIMVDVITRLTSNDLFLDDDYVLPSDLRVVPSRATQTDEGWVVPVSHLIEITHSEYLLD